MIHVTVYSRKDCHLCDEAKQTLKKFSIRYPLQIEEVDIDADPDAFARFNDEIPVIFVEGRKLFKYRVDAKKLERALKNLVS